MDRRGFLKAVGAATVAAPIPAAAPQLAAGSLGFVERFSFIKSGTNAAKNALLPSVASTVYTSGLVAAAWDAWHAASEREQLREWWYLAYRAHRIAVRRGKVKREPARLIWARVKLKDARRRRDLGFYEKPITAGPQFGAKSKRFSAQRSAGRKRTAMRRLGFFKAPWEYER